jgi:predicted secreted hydrolase
MSFQLGLFEEYTSTVLSTLEFISLSKKYRAFSGFSMTTAMSNLPAIQLPKDHYAHLKAPTEWWWHVGTLTTLNQDRTFGFEINATNAAGLISFTQIMITDVQNQRHYQNTKTFPSDPKWAESDSSKPWYVKLGTPGSSGTVSMTASSMDITFMTISGSCTDLETSTNISINLEIHQEGPPLLVFGTGVKLDVNPHGTDPLSRNNYYYSFTRLSAKGSITIGSEAFDVIGVTWMDHEYGAFPNKFNWALQDATLNNGIQLSSFSIPDSLITVGLSFASFVSILWPDGTSTFEKSVTTALNPIWQSQFPTPAEGITYFTQFKVEIPKLDVALLFNAMLPNQEFAQQGTKNPTVWEGIATVEGSFAGKMVTGTAWIEQDFWKPSAANLAGGRASFVDMGRHK